MRCEEVLNKLNAQCDRELPAEQAVAFDAHLAGCAECREAAEGLRAMDSELRRAFFSRRAAAERLAERVAAMLPETTAKFAAGEIVTVMPPVTASTRFSWGHALLAVAAGFLLAVALFRPWQQEAEELTVLSVKPVARMAAASGPVEVLPEAKLESLMCPTGASIEQNSIVRTGATVKCEIATPDGNELRLDCNTEVKLCDDDVVEVNHGRLYSCSKPGKKGIEIQSGGGRIVAKDAAQWAVDCQPNAMRLIVAEGTVKVQSGEETIAVGPGQQVRIVQGKVDGAPDGCDALLETAWVNSLLALRNSNHPEFVQRVQQLLANIGAAKLSLMYEDELRRLGDDGVPPLLAYLDSSRESPRDARRATAARIVADVAESRWIPELIGLLTDANVEVRSHAARGLMRLTGRDQGCDAKTWQSESWETCQGAHQKWRDWWLENRDRYPTARREIPEVKTPPF